MPRILIVTNGHLCRNPRAVKEAETLGRAGHEVTVLHVSHNLAAQALDDALAADSPYRRIGVEAGSGRGLARLGRRLITWTARHGTRLMGWQTLYALGPFGALLRHARRNPADLTIVHNEVPHAVGLRLNATGRRVVADIEDWHSEDLRPSDRAGRPLKLLRRVERDLLHRCIHTTTTSHALAHALHERFGGRNPHTITNSFPLQPAPSRTSPGIPPAFFWFSQTLGPGRGLESFLAAWARTSPPSRVVLLGDSPDDYRERLRAEVPQVRRPWVSFLDCVSPAALPGVIAAHDIGLALEEPAIVSRNLTITNKILQYLNAGLAVVASNTAGQREVLAASPAAGILVRLAETAAFTRALDDLLINRAALSQRQRAARQLAENTYCWEREAPRLLALVESALEPDSRRN